MPYIDPYPDDDRSFGAAELTAASKAWEHDPATVSDRQLKMLASYDRDIAATGWARRQAARDALYAKHITALAAPARPAVAQKTHQDAVKHLGECITVIVEFLKSMNGKNGERNTRLDMVEARLAGLEQKSFVVWGDDYEPGKTYFRDQWVRKSGSYWRVLKTTTSEPGTDPSWQLWQRRSPKDNT